MWHILLINSIYESKHEMRNFQILKPKNYYKQHYVIY